MVVNRNGKDTTLNLPENVIGELIDRRDVKRTLMLQRLPSIVGAYNPKDTSLGNKAGLKPFDRIIAVNGEPVQFVDEINTIGSHHKGNTVTLDVLRGTDTVQLTNKVNCEGRLEIALLKDTQYDSLGYFKTIHTKYGFFEAFPAGVRKAGEKLKFYVDQFKLILNPKTGAYKGVGGFKSIGSVFPTTWSWEAFWNITAFLSIILAFMNLLPIPGLDGGHVMFTLWEMITGKKPSDKFLEYAQLVGFVILIGLMLYANGNDWFGWGNKSAPPVPTC